MTKGNEPSSVLDLRLEHVALGRHVDLGSKLSNLSEGRDGLHESVETFAGESRDFDGGDLSSYLLEHHSSGTETGLDRFLQR